MTMKEELTLSRDHSSDEMGERQKERERERLKREEMREGEGERTQEKAFTMVIKYCL